MRSIAFFDFDGTITRKDSLFVFLRYLAGRPVFYLKIFILSPVLIGLKLKLLSNQKAKEIVLGTFFRGMPAARFNEVCEKFAREALPAIIRKSALKKIQELQGKQVSIVVVTASPENWVKPWCVEQKLTCIGTILQVNNQTVSGKIKGKNCRGQEKVNRIIEKYNVRDYSEVLAFGDSRDDIPMFQLAHKSYFKLFKE